MALVACTRLAAFRWNSHNHTRNNNNNNNKNSTSLSLLHCPSTSITTKAAEFGDIWKRYWNLDVTWKVRHLSYERGMLLAVAVAGVKQKSESGNVRVLVKSRKVEEVEEQKHEIRVCVNRSCRRSGAMQTLDMFKSLAPPNVLVESCSCLGRCGAGPNLVILPPEVFVSYCNTTSHVARLLEIQCGAYDHVNNLKGLALKQKGNAAFENGNLSLAESMYSEAIQLKPSGGLHFLYANRSAVKLARGDLESSLEDALNAGEVAPKWAVAYLHQGEAYTAMGKHVEALSAYNKACSFDLSLSHSKSFQQQLRKLQAACNTLPVSV